MKYQKISFLLGLGSGLLIGWIGFIAFRYLYKEPSSIALREMVIIKKMSDEHMARAGVHSVAPNIPELFTKGDLDFSFDKDGNPLDPWGIPYVISFKWRGSSPDCEICSIGSGGEYRLILGQYSNEDGSKVSVPSP
jgi:hypothetical protein